MANMHKLALINQPAGLGDILYTLKIGKSLADQGYKVVWPLIPEYMWLKNYIYVQGLRFISEQDIPERLRRLYHSRYSGVVREVDFIYLPLRYVLLNGEVGVEDLPMLSKYMLANMTEAAFSWWELYKDALILSPSKGSSLFIEKQCKRPYSYVNDLVGSPDGKHLHSVKVMFNHSDICTSIKNSLEPQYTLFDWWIVFDNANEIHTPDTSICFFVDILTRCFSLCRGTTLYMYARDPKRPNVPQYLTSCFSFDNTTEHSWRYIRP